VAEIWIGTKIITPEWNIIHQQDMTGDTEAMGSPMGTHDLRRPRWGMALPVSAPAEAMVCGGTRPVGAPLRPGRDRAPAGDVEYDSLERRRGQGGGATIVRRRFQGRDDAAAGRSGGRGRRFSITINQKPRARYNR